MGPGARTGEWLTPRAGLVCVAVLFVAAQVWLVRDVPLGWDETIYASQDDPRRPALAFTAPRARGMSWVAAPLQAVTGSPVALRVYLAVLAAVTLYLAYAVWLRLRPDASVPLAALGFASLWITLFYGPSLMPNMAIALAGVLATGTLLCAALRRGPGWLPWVVEAEQRYDGLTARVRRAISTQSTGERFVPDYQLRALDGPLLCRPCDRASQDIPATGLMWWVAGSVLVVLAVWLVLRGRDAAGFRGAPRSVTVAPALAGLLLALPYLFLVGYAAPRFLLPAYALLALPAAQALRHLCLRRGGPVTDGEVPAVTLRPVAIAVVAVLVAGQLAVQYRQLEEIVHGTRGRVVWQVVARSLERHDVRPPCVLVGPESAPVAYHARCDAVHLARVPGDEPYGLADLRRAADREPVALVLRSRQGVPGYARGWVPLPAADLPRGWRVYVAPGPSAARS